LKRLVAVQANAERRASLQELVAMCLPLVEAHDHRTCGWKDVSAARVDERARDELTVFDERHQAARLSSP
jgi:hypothetical protein